MRVERVAATSRSPNPKFTPKKLGVQKVTVRTVATKPANHLDKHRA